MIIQNDQLIPTRCTRLVGGRASRPCAAASRGSWLVPWMPGIVVIVVGEMGGSADGTRYGV